MTDTLFLQCRTYLFRPKTTSQNRCDLKSKAGRCSGADLGFWDGFTSVLDITFKDSAEVTMAVRVVLSSLPSEALRAMITDGLVPAPWPGDTNNGRRQCDRVRVQKTHLRRLLRRLMRAIL